MTRLPAAVSRSVLTTTTMQSFVLCATQQLQTDAAPSLHAKAVLMLLLLMMSVALLTLLLHLLMVMPMLLEAFGERCRVLQMHKAERGSAR
jgi:hypothetical protein